MSFSTVRQVLGWKQRILIVLAATLFLVASGFSFQEGDDGQHLSPVQASESSTLSQGASQSPTQAPPTNNQNDGSPRSYVTKIHNTSSLSGACEYLSFCRWWKANSLPLPSVGLTSMSQLGPASAGSIGQLFFSIAGFAVFVLGYILMYAISFDFLTKAAFTVDHIFSQIGTNVLGMNGSGIYQDSIGPLTLFVLIILIAGGYQWAKPTSNSRYFQFGTKTLVTGLLAIGCIGIVTHQATLNHSDLARGSSNISEVGRSGGGTGSILDSPGSNVTSKPSNWAPLSPGWFISQTTSIVNGIAGIATSWSSDFGNAASSATTPQGTSSSCERYQGAMNAAFRSTDAYRSTLHGKGEVLTSYDKLVQSIYFQSYSSASTGESQGARQSWCRFVENQSKRPVGEQMLLAREAGLYKEAVGSGGIGLTDPGAVVVDSNGDKRTKVRQEEGEYVDSSGSWKGNDKSQTINNAQNLMGPIYPDSSSGAKASAFWAACSWPTPSNGSGSGVSINPEWARVKGYDSEEYLKKEDCLSPIRNSDQGGFGSDQAEKWNYHDEKPGVVSSFIGMGGSESGSKFRDAVNPAGDSSNNPALEYYLTLQGGNASTSLVYGLTSITMIYLTIKYFGPLIVGGALSQFLAIAILILLVFLLLFLALPLRRTREVGKTLIKTEITASAVSSGLAIVFGLEFAFANLFSSLLGSVGTTGFMQALQIAIGNIVAFWVIRQLLSMLFGPGFNSSFQGGALAPLGWAGAPALREFGGMDVASPLDRGFWLYDKKSNKKDNLRDDKKSETSEGNNRQSKKDDENLTKGVGGSTSKSQQAQGQQGAKGQQTGKRMEDPLGLSGNSHQKTSQAASTGLGAALRANGGGKKSDSGNEKVRDMLGNIVPVKPTLSKTGSTSSGIALPSDSDISQYGTHSMSIPGFKSSQETRTGDDNRGRQEQVKKMFDRFNNDALGSVDSSRNTFQPGSIERTGSTAWMVNPDNGLYLPDSVIPDPGDSPFQASPFNDINDFQNFLEGRRDDDGDFQYEPGTFPIDNMLRDNIGTHVPSDEIDRAQSDILKDMFDRPYDDPPAGVSSPAWDDWGDLRQWANSSGDSLDLSNVESWPGERQEQFSNIVASVQENQQLASDRNPGMVRATFEKILDEMRPGEWPEKTQLQNELAEERFNSRETDFFSSE